MSARLVAIFLASAAIFIYYATALALALNHIFRSRSEAELEPDSASLAAFALYATAALALLLYLIAEFATAAAPAGHTFEWRLKCFLRATAPALLVATVVTALLTAETRGLVTVYGLPLLSTVSTLSALLVPAAASFPLAILTVYALAPHIYTDLKKR